MPRGLLRLGRMLRGIGPTLLDDEPLNNGLRLLDDEPLNNGLRLLDDGPLNNGLRLLDDGPRSRPRLLDDEPQKRPTLRRLRLERERLLQPNKRE